MEVNKGIPAEADRSPGIPGLWQGCVLWGIFGVLALAIRGVRWDENYEFAQVIAGQIPYPAGHPLHRYVFSAYNLQLYASAALLKILPSAVVLCSVRNLLFILATVVPIYVLGAVVSQRALCGHLAAALFLAGIHLDFDGAYPQFLWPGMFSNGHIGMAFALLLVCLLAQGHIRTGFLMLGLMPAVHLGQLPPTLLFGGFYVLAQWRRHQLEPIVHAIPFFVSGIAVALIFFAVQHSFVVAPPVDGPYFSIEDARPIWEGRLAFHDMHRQIPLGNSHILVAGALILGGLGLTIERRSSIQGPSAWRWLFVYVAGLLLIVYSIMAVHAALGTKVPYLFLGWLPYRLVNHIAPVLVAFMVTVLATDGSSERRGGPQAVWLIAATLLFVLLKPYLGSLLPPDVSRRYLSGNESVLFFLYGASFVLLTLRLEEKSTSCIPLRLGAIAGWWVLAWLHQYGAACALGGALAALALVRIHPGAVAAQIDRYGRRAAGLLAALLARIAHRNESPHRVIASEAWQSL